MQLPTQLAVIGRIVDGTKIDSTAWKSRQGNIYTFVWSDLAGAKAWASKESSTVDISIVETNIWFMGLMSSTVEWAIFDPPPMFRRVGAVEQCELQKLNLKSACEMWPILKAMMRDLGTKEESLQFFEPMILNDIDLKPLDAIKTLGELARLVCGGKPMTRVETRITEARNRDPIPKVVQREVWRRDQGRCVECGSKEKLEFDHIIPHSKGGADSARNLQLLCESCNRRKGNLDPGQF